VGLLILLDHDDTLRHVLTSHACTANVDYNGPAAAAAAAATGRIQYAFLPAMPARLMLTTIGLQQQQCEIAPSTAASPPYGSTL
jgi:hypothetical protein